MGLDKNGFLTYIILKLWSISEFFVMASATAISEEKLFRWVVSSHVVCPCQILYKSDEHDSNAKLKCDFALYILHHTCILYPFLWQNSS